MKILESNLNLEIYKSNTLTNHNIIKQCMFVHVGLEFITMDAALV